MTKTEKTILRLEQVIHHLETDGKYLADRFLQEAVEDIKSSADLLEMAYDDLRFSPTCATCKFFEGVTTNNKSWVCEQCIINNQYRVPTNWQWRGDEQ